MDFSQEKFISNFIESQFPAFYQEEGENFILFVKAYYEWLEEDGNPVGESRRLLEYRDIDTIQSDTFNDYELGQFLLHFQQKYLYGIPFKTITSKRFLLKHILDVYRSKGTIQCYRLLFKLVYGEDVEIYLPGKDILRASDGIWKEPIYIELSDSPVLSDYVGKTIVGVTSGASAVVENYVRENFSGKNSSILYVSNIRPAGADFKVDEPVVLQGDESNTAAIAIAPHILGSLDYIEIFSGGQGFKLGDIFKIASNDLDTGKKISEGVEGMVKVSETAIGYGSLYFNILDGGWGFTANASTFTYRGLRDNYGNGATFQIGSIISPQDITYNTDLICDIVDVNTAINATSYGFTNNPGANIVSAIGSNLSLNSISYSGTPLGYNNNDVIVFVSDQPGGVNAVVTMVTNSTGGALYFTISNNGSAFVNSTPTVLITNVSHGSAYGNTNTSIITYTIKNSNGCLKFNTSTFGKISSLSNIRIGNNYVQRANTFVRSTLTSKTMRGNVSYSSTNTRVFSIGAVGTMSGYSNTDYVTVINPSGVNAVASVTTNTSGGITSVTMTNYGANFSVPTSNIMISNSTGGNSAGSGAQFEATFLPYITGVNTAFTSIFSGNSVIQVQANSSLLSTKESIIVKQVVNSTSMFLYGRPTLNSTSSAVYRIMPTILPSQFPTYDSIMRNPSGSVYGENQSIDANYTGGAGVVAKVKLFSSGKGYVQEEYVKGYLFGAISNNIIILNPGQGYSNNEKMIFSGGFPSITAQGYITTDANGSIVTTTLTKTGSGYDILPKISIQTEKGSGASLICSLNPFNITSEITGKVVLKGSGKGRGYWLNTQGFLNSNKYIQDSYYYQDYSYEIQVARTLDKYKNILYNTFHSSGSELFGKFLLINVEEQLFGILEEPTKADILPIGYQFLCSSGILHCDSSTTTDRIS
jgi:hypothetical protein